MALRRRAFRDLQSRVFEGTVYRHLSTQYEALDTSGSIKAGGRWNPKGEFGALYTALAEETALAELERLALRQGLSLDDLASRDLVAIQVSVSKVLDLTDEGTLERIGVRQSEIMGYDVSRCVEISRLARRAGFEAVLAPSATNRGPILVVYPDRLLSSSSLEVSERRKILRN